MSRGAWEAQPVAVKIYNLCYLNHRAHREHRAFLPFSVSSLNSVVNIGIIFYPTYSSMKHVPLLLHSCALNKQPTAVVHVASVRRGRGMSNFTPGESVRISTGHGPGSVVCAGHGCRNI